MGGGRVGKTSGLFNSSCVVFHLIFLWAAIGRADAGEGRPAEGGPPQGKQAAIDRKSGTVALPAAVARQGTYDVLKGAIEYALVSKGGKDYETLFVTDVPPAEIREALLAIGLKPGRPAKEASLPAGPPVRVLVEYEEAGKERRRPIDEFVLSVKTGKPLEAGPWTYTGSVPSVDPRTKAETLQCVLTGNIIGLHWSDTSPLLQNPRPEARDENIYRSNLKELPEAGKPVRIVFQREERELPPGWKRVHAFASGRVQGVGYREFAQREARGLSLVGFVENLPDGRVEAVIEGPEEKVKQLLAKLARGPRAAQVTGLDQKDEPPEGAFKDFEIRS